MLNTHISSFDRVILSSTMFQFISETHGKLPHTSLPPMDNLKFSYSILEEKTQIHFFALRKTFINPISICQLLILSDGEVFKNVVLPNI